MLVYDYDWSKADDAEVWRAAQGGADGAAEELRKREHKARVGNVSPEVRALMASRIKNGRPGR